MCFGVSGFLASVRLNVKSMPGGSEVPGRLRSLTVEAEGEEACKALLAAFAAAVHELCAEGFGLEGGGYRLHTVFPHEMRTAAFGAACVHEGGRSVVEASLHEWSASEGEEGGKYGKLAYVSAESCTPYRALTVALAGLLGEAGTDGGSARVYVLADVLGEGRTDEGRGRDAQ